jgi:hypothetical protein
MPDFFWFFFCCCSISRSSVVLALISSFQQASKQRLGSQPKYTHTLCLSVRIYVSVSVSPITLRLPGDTRSSNWVPAPKLFRCSSSSFSSANRSSPNFFSFYSIRSLTRHLLASAHALSSILGFFFLSFACLLAATSADLPEELRNPARAAAGATAAATAGERERERGREGERRSSSTGARAGPVLVRGCPGQVGRSDGRTGGRAGGVGPGAR